MKIFNFKKIGGFSLSLAVIFSFHFALAQETGIPENLAPLAQELGCQTKEECAKAFDSNFEKGLELAEKYQVYGKEQNDIAKSYKQEVISRINSLSEENFEEEIVKIAKELLKKPKLAQSFQLDKGAVTAAETIVKEIKDAGADVEVCSRSADTLSREELISCLEASKRLAKRGSIVEKYVPKGIIEKSEMAEMAADLDEALARGEYSELGKTAEEAGQKCLRSGSESLKSCDEIARKFFGTEGVKELAAARAQTKQAGDFYLKNSENMELITPDGRKIAGKTAIKNACEKAFETRDVKLARACGDFAVRNGFTSKEEMEKGLKLFESMADKNINFDECRSNPEICEEFIPEEHKQEFEGNKKIYEIMKSEAGFNPIECERGNVDFEIGRKCFEASKKALPKLKEIAKDYPDVQRMVAEIEFGIKRETEQNQKGDDFGKFFSQQAGPGGCRNEKECFAYCNDPAHGAECISFGAKHEVFQGNEAVERYQRYNDILTSPSPAVYNQPRQDGYYGDSRYNQGGPGSGRQMYPYSASDNRGPYVNQGGFGGQGPSPECFAAIQSGDFAKAKEICSVPANPYQYQQQAPYQSYPNDRYRSDRPCPAVAIAQCPEGQYREKKFTDNCPVYGQCLPIPNYQSSSPVNKICPSMPEYNCQSGYQKIYRTTPDGCGVSECVPVSNSSYPSYDEKEKCYRGGGFWTGNYCDYQSRSSASYSSYGNSNYSSYGYVGSCPSGLLNLLGSGCHYMYNDNSGNKIYCNGEMTKSAKYGDTVVVDGCASTGNYSSYSYSSYNYTPPSNQKEQIWNSYGLRSWIRTDASLTRIENLKQVCANVTSFGGNIWMPGAGDYNSQDFGMPDEAKCRSWTPGSQSSYSYSSYSYSSYPTYSSCTTAMVSLLGSGCHFMYNDSSNTAVYCNGEMTKSAKLGDTAAKDGCQSSGGGGGYSSYGSYSSYPSSAYSSYSYSSYNYQQCDWSTQYLKNSTQTCAPRTNCYDTANADYNSSECQGVRGYTSYSSYSSQSSYPSSAYSSYSYSSYDASSACSQTGGSWDGTSCVMPSAASSAAAYSSASADPSVACSQAGGSWDGATCVMPGVTTFNNRGGGLVASLGEVLKGILKIFSR